MKTFTLRKPKNNFTQVPNRIILDKEISLKAKGLFVFMLSKPDNWKFTLQSISSQLKDGMDSVRSAMTELKKFGYVVYKKLPDGSGIYDLDYEPNVENPHVENPNVGKPTRISNTIEVDSIESNKDNSKPQTPKGDSFDFDLLLKFICTNTGRDFKVINKKVRQSYLARLKDGYPKTSVVNAIVNCCAATYHKENGYQYLTPEFFSRASTLDKYGTATAETNKAQKQGEYIGTIQN